MRWLIVTFRYVRWSTTLVHPNGEHASEHVRSSPDSSLQSV